MVDGVRVRDSHCSSDTVGRDFVRAANYDGGHCSARQLLPSKLGGPRAMRIRLLSCLLLLCSGTLAQAECTYPRAPSDLPDGRTATQEQMVVGMKAIKDYNAQVTTYLACLDEKMNADIAAAGPDASSDVIAQIKAINAKRHNAAIEELESNAAGFNEQVRTFRAKEKAAKDKE
jgi:hypothetical protein